MKALYPTISYTLFIVISVAALSVLLISIRGFAEGTQTTYAQSQLECAADIVRNDIMSIYSANSSGVVQSHLPAYIAGKRYSIEAENNIITVSMEMSGRQIRAARTIDASIQLQGREYAPISLDYQKDDGTLVIR